MTETLVLSIQPKYAELIFKGKKRFELRRNILRAPLERLAIHVCGEDPNCYQGIAKVGFFTRADLEFLWRMTEGRNGLTREQFDDYFRNCEEGTAISLYDAQRIDPTPLSDLGLKSAPQSIAYAKEI